MAVKAKHTPGPWILEQDESGFYIRMEALAGKDDYLAIYASPNLERREADAVLISLAPELFEVHIKIVALLDDPEAWKRNAESQRRLRKVLQMSKAVIAKAQVKEV